MAAWLANVGGIVPIGILALLFLLFPTGHLPFPRWRPVGWVLGLAIETLTVLSIVVSTSAWSDPFAESGPSLGRADIAFFVSFYLLLFVMVASLVSLGIRYAHSKGEERLQLKWFFFAAVPVAIAFAGTALTNSPIASFVFTLALLFLCAPIAIAIAQYRLYEIDVVISRAVVFGSLVVFITVVYVGIVVGVGTVVGSRRARSFSAVAAAIVAVAFQPVRQWRAGWPTASCTAARDAVRGAVRVLGAHRRRVFDRGRAAAHGLDRRRRHGRRARRRVVAPGR